MGIEQRGAKIDYTVFKYDKDYWDFQECKSNVRLSIWSRLSYAQDCQDVQDCPKLSRCSLQIIIYSR